MAKHHLQFKNFHRGILEATEDLFRSKPWRGGEAEQHEKFSRWLRHASAVYHVPEPTFRVWQSGRASYSGNTIVLGAYSVTSLFHEFRHHLQWHDDAAPFDPEGDALGWSCSLFYTVRPKLFRKAVRAGRIAGVTPDDLLSRESLEQQREELATQRTQQYCAALIDAGSAGSTVEFKRRIVLPFLKWVLTLDENEDEDLIERYARENWESLTPATQTKYVTVLNQFAKWAEARENATV